MLLGVGGTLYRFHMWAHYNAERPDGVDYMLTLPVSCGKYRAMKFAVRDVTMTYIQDETNGGPSFGIHQ